MSILLSSGSMEATHLWFQSTFFLVIFPVLYCISLNYSLNYYILLPIEILMPSDLGFSPFRILYCWWTFISRGYFIFSACLILYKSTYTNFQHFLQVIYCSPVILTCYFLLKDCFISFWYVFAFISFSNPIIRSGMPLWFIISHSFVLLTLSKSLL